MSDPTATTQDAAPKKPSLATHPGVTGGAGVAAGGIFSFALLTEMGMKDQLANAHSTFAFICAVTVLCLLILACLLVGYMTLTRGVAKKAPPMFWAGMIVFAVIGTVGLTAIVIDYFRNPAVDAQIFLDQNSDLSALGGDPPVKLAVYLKGSYALTSDRLKSQSVPIQNGEAVPVTIYPIGDLRAELKSMQDLRAQQAGGQTMRELFLQACVFVPTTNGLHQQCQAFQNGFAPP